MFVLASTAHCDAPHQLFIKCLYIFPTTHAFPALQDMHVRAGKKQLEMLWRASASWGEYAQVRAAAAGSSAAATQAAAAAALCAFAA
jgi:hypothetical protein